MVVSLECPREGNFSKLEDFVGLPYDEWGRNPDVGLDCWSLPNTIYSTMGAPLPPRPSSCMPVAWCEARLIEFGWKKVDRPQRFDLLIFRYPFRAVNHLGIFLGARRFLHTTPKTGACISTIGQGWLRSLVGVFMHESVRAATKVSQ